MTLVDRRFLPDRFRPRMPRHRPRRRFLIPVVALTVGLLVAPLWKVQSVEVYGGDVVPSSVRTSLEGLVGHMVPSLELEWLHQLAATWPAATEVRVHMKLPGTIVVEIFPEPPRGSVPVGAGWHAVAADGRLAGALSEPYQPQLVGFRRPSDRRLAFSVARRIAEASGGEVSAVYQVTPADYRVDLWFDGPRLSTTIHVIPEGTAAEVAWCEMMMNGGAMVDWADLRWPYRMVLRVHARTTPAFRIPLAPHLRLGLNLEILNVGKATPPISLNRPSQICGTSGRAKQEVVFARTLGTGARRDFSTEAPHRPARAHRKFV